MGGDVAIVMGWILPTAPTSLAQAGHGMLTHPWEKVFVQVLLSQNIAKPGLAAWPREWKLPQLIPALQLIIYLGVSAFI